MYIVCNIVTLEKSVGGFKRRGSVTTVSIQTYTDRTCADPHG